MTANDPALAAAVERMGALPVPMGNDRSYRLPAPHITRADVPLAEVQEQLAEKEPQTLAERTAYSLRLEADVRQIVARQQACQLLADAAEHSHSPSDQIAYHLDEWLVTHPKAAVTQLADYPAWAAEMAARETANRAARNALREMS